METYYTLLDVPVGASAEEIAAAYQRQRERYSPARVAALGPEFQRIAEARLAELEQAYRVLSDPQRRRDYEASLGVVPPSPARGSPHRAGLSRRELVGGMCDD